MVSFKKAISLPLVPLVLGLLGAGCTATLPFDEVSGGEPRPKGPAPIAYFRMEDGPGVTSPRDSLGAHTAVLDDEDGDFPQWTDKGKKGGGITFPVDDGWMWVSSMSGTRFPKKGTFAAWVQIHTRAEDGSGVFYIEQESDNDNEDDDDVITLWLADDAVYLGSAILETPGVEVKTDAVPLETWALVTVEWDIEVKKMFLALRVDGKPMSKRIESPLAPDFALTRPLITVDAEGGTVDEVRFWDRLLTDEELAALE